MLAENVLRSVEEGFHRSLVVSGVPEGFSTERPGEPGALIEFNQEMKGGCKYSNYGKNAYFNTTKKE